MRLIDLFEAHERELACEIVTYSLGGVRGRWFVGALEAIYSGLIERIRELESDREEIRNVHLPVPAAMATTYANVAQDFPDGPHVLAGDEEDEAGADQPPLQEEPPAAEISRKAAILATDLRRACKKPRDPEDRARRIEKAKELIRQGMKFRDVCVQAQVHGALYGEAKKQVDAEAGENAQDEPEPACTKLPFVVGDEPFVAPSTFGQPLSKAPGKHTAPERHGPRVVDVAAIGYQKRVLALRAMAQTGNRSEAGKASGLLPDEVDAIWLLHGERLQMLTQTYETEIALQKMLKHWISCGPDPDARAA